MTIKYSSCQDTHLQDIPTKLHFHIPNPLIFVTRCVDLEYVAAVIRGMRK